VCIHFGAILETGILVVFSKDRIVGKTIETQKGSPCYRRLLLCPSQQLMTQAAMTPRTSYHKVVNV